MTRRERRSAKKETRKDIVEFLKIQKHYFPHLVHEIRQIIDPRNQSYTDYEVEVILYTVMMKNVCTIKSMQQMTQDFNDDICVKNIYQILGLKEREFLPHYVTINECLGALDHEELEKFRQKLIYTLIRKRSFENARFINKHWKVIVDGTHLFNFSKRHCEHCLKMTKNKGTPEETTYYYHNVLEAKIIFGDNLVISIATEFIENEDENIEKQDCELKAFKRLSKKLKDMFPRLPICLLADSLYACESVFQICKDNQWGYIIRFKDGSIPTLAKEYKSIINMGEGEQKTSEIIKTFKRKPSESIYNKMRWVSALDYVGHMVTVFDLVIEQEGSDSKRFQWITNLKITYRNAGQFAQGGRSRWKIENEGFNLQKNYRYNITHANSLDYNAMKNHYLLTQISDILVQLYEYGNAELREIKRTIKNISSDILKCLTSVTLTPEDISYICKRTSICVY